MCGAMYVLEDIREEGEEDILCPNRFSVKGSKLVEEGACTVEEGLEEGEEVDEAGAGRCRERRFLEKG